MLDADPSGKDATAVLASIDAVKAELNQALAGEPGNSRLLYLQGLADFATGVPLKNKGDRSVFERRQKAAVTELEKVREAPWSYEAAALEGYILAQLIGVEGGISGMELGPKSEEKVQLALRNLPRSPRVLLFRGLILWSTPESYGGDAVQGRAMLEAARGAFQAQSAGTPGPHWGQAYALGWLGSARAKDHDLRGAWEAWNEALTASPDYLLVKTRLLPSLKKRGFVPPTEVK